MGKKKKQLKAELAIKKSNEDYMQRLKPLLFAFISWFVLLSLLHLPGVKDFVRNVMISFTHASAIGMGKLLFLPVADKGYPVIDFAGFSMQVILECTAYNFYLFVLMITVFAPWTIRQKLINISLFAGIIFLTNNLRFLIMGAIGRFYPATFEYIHDYLWNILFALMIFLIFLRVDRKSGNRFFSAIK